LKPLFALYILRIQKFSRRVPQAAAALLASVCFTVSTGCAPSIHDAIARGNINAVHKLLNENPDLVNARDGKQKTPLHCAVTYKQREVMELLIEKGAAIGARDITGMTPLHVAAMLGRRDEAELLLQHGADPL